MEKLEECPYRFGFTGTLDGTQTHRLVLEGLFGKVEKVISTKELMDKETLNYKQDVSYSNILKKKQNLLKTTHMQRKWIYLATHKRRNDFIVNLCKTLSGNTL